jgi:hypothetical protein
MTVGKHLSLALAMIVGFLSQTYAREWTDATGQHSIEAELQNS